MRDFVASGYASGQPQDADIIVVNTCAVTSISERKSRKALRRAVKENPHAVIIATGCAVEMNPEFAKFPGVGRIVGSDDKMSISRSFEPISTYVEKMPQNRARVLLKVQDGCDHHCAYCIVPKARGAGTSVPSKQVIGEARELVAAGAREIVLTGIDLGSYQDPVCCGLSGLIAKLEEVPGLAQIRLSSIEVTDISNEILERMIPAGTVCRHLHIPLQSGSKRILKLMNRTYSPDLVRERISEIRDKIPGIAIIFDVIAGFPGETEADFAETVRLIEDCKPAKIHAFSYSIRPDTPAACMPEQVPELVKRTRMLRLKELSDELRKDFLTKATGMVLPAIVEKSQHADHSMVVTDNYIKAIVATDGLKFGHAVTVMIAGFEDGKVVAEIVVGQSD